jgi:phosphoglycolate phosphatase-like HAD superfamily hydrolase
MRYKHIFWDFNGTIIDDVHNALSCVNDMLGRKGMKPISLAEYYDYVDTPIINFYYHILPPEDVDFSEGTECDVSGESKYVLYYPFIPVTIDNVDSIE